MRRVSVCSFSISKYMLQDGTPDMGASLDEAITKLNADIEKMAPNMKAVTKYVVFSLSSYVSSNAGLKTD
jgi:hypothetical protein